MHEKSESPVIRSSREALKVLNSMTDPMFISKYAFKRMLKDGIIKSYITPGYDVKCFRRDELEALSTKLLNPEVV